MEDGSLAVGLFNRGVVANHDTTKWSALGLAGKQRVHDLWRQQDLGTADGSYTATVPKHGVVMIRISKDS